MQELELLSDKLDVLLKKYTALKAENKSMKETIAQQLRSLESLSGKLGIAEEQLLAKGLNNSLGDDKEKEAMRKQLDSVIGEIDKILTTLND